MARTLIADPECINKAKAGEDEKIRPCVRCNTCIDRTHGHRLSVRCAVNPVCGREIELKNFPASTGKKKVVIIGGGPSGMEAARTAVDRGHEVVLFEKSGSLGGTLSIASVAPFKNDMKRYLDWAIRSTTNTPYLSVRLSTEATPDIIKAENPDILIIAAGSVPIIPTIPGIDGENIVIAGDVVTGKKVVGKRCVVVGAGLAGSETALLLAQQSKKVTLIDRLSLGEVDAGHPHISITALRARLRDLDVAIRTEINLEKISETGVVLAEKNGDHSEIPCDTVVLALGLKPRRETIERLSGLAPETFVVGDCNNDRGTLYSAVSEGFLAAMNI